MGPYAVAELRTTDLLATHKATAPPGGMHLYVTDTLDDPHAAETQLGSGMQLIAQSRKKANEVKARANVTVVIGNPPYKELAIGDGGWVESGSQADGQTARGILEDFFEQGAGRFKAKLKNLYVYFWRWATWKVWESTTAEPDGDAGVVCFISTSGYLAGPGFAGMRRYLRGHASEGWIIDLTPEGQTPDIPTRIFPGVRQPLAIGLFIRRPDSDPDIPATIRYRSVSGRQAEKFAELAHVSLDDDGWRDTRTEWTTAFTPAAESGWDTYPAIAQIMPWYSPGVFPTRTWVYAPSAMVLKDRWNRLTSEIAPNAKSALFKEGRDANLTKVFRPLPGIDTHPTTGTPLATDNSTHPQPIRVSYRSFDRQWILPDARVMDMPRRNLWSARVPGQVFTTEQHSSSINDGPGLVFTWLIPDFDCFNGRGGRTLPLLHPDGTANIAPGLLGTLTAELHQDVTAAEMLAYVASVVAHPAYTRTFADELTTPGVRVPLTGDPALWADAVDLGEQVLWLHTYGETFAGTDRRVGSVRYPRGDVRQPLARTPITAMPEAMTYDADRAVVALGDGEFGPVVTAVWEYTVGGKNVLKSWFNYRKAVPGGKKTSPLDYMHVDAWDPDWTIEFIDLLTVLSRLVDLEPAQADLLARIVAGPVHTVDDLRQAGVSWPTVPADRKPHFGLGGQVDSSQPALDL